MSSKDFSLKITVKVNFYDFLVVDLVHFKFLSCLHNVLVLIVLNVQVVDVTLIQIKEVQSGAWIHLPLSLHKPSSLHILYISLIMSSEHE